MGSGSEILTISYFGITDFSSSHYPPKFTNEWPSWTLSWACQLAGNAACMEAMALYPGRTRRGASLGFAPHGLISDFLKMFKSKSLLVLEIATERAAMQEGYLIIRTNDLSHKEFG